MNLRFTFFTWHFHRFIFSILWRWLGPFIDGYFFHRSHEWSVESDILMDMVGGPIPTPIQCTVFGKRKLIIFHCLFVCLFDLEFELFGCLACLHGGLHSNPLLGMKGRKWHFDGHGGWPYTNTNSLHSVWEEGNLSIIAGWIIWAPASSFEIWTFHKEFYGTAEKWFVGPRYTQQGRTGGMKGNPMMKTWISWKLQYFPCYREKQ